MSRVKRGEWLLLAGAIAFGTGLRVYRLPEIGLSHFDEGIYALSGLWPWTGGMLPDQGFYSPPLYPLLVGLVSLLLGGPSDLSPVLVSALFGVATIPLAWRMGRLWWGPGEGLLAAWLVAGDGPSIAFSRIGLTDGTFTFLFLLSLLCLQMGIQSGGWWRLVGAGLVVGSTWNTKYNGFLPLVLSLGFCFGPNQLVKIRRLAIMASVGILAYLPWALTFHVEHGYGALVAHQAGYWRGIGGLGDGWLKATHGLVALRLPWPAAVLLVASFVCGRCGLGATVIGMFGSLVALSAWAEELLLLLVVASVLRSPSRPGRVAAAWMLAWLIMLPALYSPYVRLWLPTHTVVLVFAAAGWWYLLGAKAPEPAVAGSARKVPLAVAGSGVFLATAWWSGLSPLPEVTAGYRSAATKIVERCQRDGLVVSALARPPLFYYLALGGDSGPIPARRLDSTASAMAPPAQGELLIVDPGIPFSGKLPGPGEAHARVDPTAFHVEPSAVTWLDEHGEWCSPLERTQSLRLFESAAPRGP